MAHTSPVVRATTDHLMMMKHRGPHRDRATAPRPVPTMRVMAPARPVDHDADTTLTDDDQRLLADAPAAECA